MPTAMITIETPSPLNMTFKLPFLCLRLGSSADFPPQDASPGRGFDCPPKRNEQRSIAWRCPHSLAPKSNQARVNLIRLSKPVFGHVKGALIVAHQRV